MAEEAPYGIEPFWQTPDAKGRQWLDFANDVKQGETTASPHSFNYTVPTSAATNSTITLQAQALDNQGTRGYSQFAYLTVKNDLPIATFTATVYTPQHSAPITKKMSPRSRLEACPPSGRTTR